MKKNLFFIPLMATMVLFSCKKDDDSNPFDVKYTNEPVEETKSNVEQNAVDMVDKLEDLTSATAFEVLMHLEELGSDAFASNPVMEPLSYLARLEDKSSVTSVFETMKATEMRLVVEPTNFSDLFNDAAGKYTYNSVTEEFVKSELDDKIVILFPGKETDLTNTASITIDNFSVTEITDPMEDWPEDLDPELPSSLDIDLKYNNVSVAGTSMAASYASNGMPTKVELSVYVDDFTFTTTALHTPYSSESWRNTLTFESDILFETYIDAEGDWSEENIEDNIAEDDEWTEVHIEEIIKNANAHVILMNLKVLGMVDVKAIGDAMWDLQNDESINDEEEYAEAMVEIINANAKLIVIYRDSNTKIASAEAYVESEDDDYYPAMRFVYADGSKVSAEQFANDDMDNFYEALNDFIETLNEEYDLYIDPVYPPSQQN